MEYEDSCPPPIPPVHVVRPDMSLNPIDDKDKIRFKIFLPTPFLH
jgi:hypothetical protein